MRRTRFLLLAGIALTTTSPASNPGRLASVAPVLVTYGHENHPREGDPNFFQILYVGVPAGMKQEFLLRVFDPDTDGEHDLAFGQYGDSETRFAVFGGAGASGGQEASREPGETRKAGGRLLAERVFGADPEIDDTWQTLATLDPADGELVDGRRIFRLLVDGFRGDDANAFTVAAGTPADPDRAPQGVEIFSFRPTLRLPSGGAVFELPFTTPTDAAALIVDTFDGYGARPELALPLRSQPLPASGDNEWQAGEIRLDDAERGGAAAITIGGGREWPNDVTLYVTDARRRPIGLTLPPRLWPARNARPEIALTVTPDDCHAVTLDAAGSSDADGDALDFRWRFHDEEEAQGARVTRRYVEPGTYPARLEVRDASLQVGHGAAHDFEVEIKSPPIAAASAPRIVAPGDPFPLDGSASSVEDGAIRSYTWTLSDGAELTGRQVRHAFAEPGPYTVTLTVEDDSEHPCDTASRELTVIANAPPVAVAGEDRRAAVGEGVIFDARDSEDSDGKLTARLWDFGDGAQARGPVVEHAYAAPGRYRARLSVRDDSRVANATTTAEVTVIVNAPPVAVAEPPQYVGGGQVRFDGSASDDEDGVIKRYTWDFGDRSTGTGATPTHVYAAPGTYEAKLTVTDDSGTGSASTDVTTRVVVNAAPIADAGPDIVAAPGEEVTLRGDRSADPDGEIADFHWDLGEGTTADGAVASHRYETPGTYLARLAVRDDSGHEEAIDFDEARVVINRRPRAEAGPDILAAPGKPVHLDGGRSFDADGEITHFRWDLSDTETPLAGRVIERKFDEPGIYTAQLTVTDDSGTSNGTARDELTIRVNHPPVAVAGAAVHTAERRVSFDASASVDPDGDPLVFHWDFGDGRTANGARVSHTYAKGGTYPVVLTVNDGTARVNSWHRDSLTVRVDQPPTAMAGEDRGACTGDVVVFDGGGSRDPEGGVLRYSWDFGDGTSSDIVNPTKVYEESGTYPVTLTVEDDSGLPGSRHSDRVLVHVNAGPVADAGEDIRACAHTPVPLDGSGSTDRDGVVNRFAWDFGDGASGGGDRPTHVYSRPGRYRAVLTIEGDQAGQCASTATDEVEVEIVAAPAPAIEAPDTTPVSAPTRFDGSASTLDGGEIHAWRWDFGDGGTAEGRVMEHRYSRPGVYRVTLAVEGDTPVAECRRVSTHRLVTVNAPPVAVAGEDRTVPAGEATSFDGSDSHDPDGGVTEYLWDFGDGTTGQGMQVRHVYREAGQHEVTLTVKDDAGVANSTVSDTLRVEVTAAPRPEIAGPAIACVEEEVRWQATDATAGLRTSYAWVLGDGEDATGVGVTHMYERPGRYAITLVANDGGDSPSTRRATTKMLRINAPPRAVAGPDRSGCPGVPVAFEAAGSTDPDGKLVRRLWDFGDGTTARGSAVEHAYERPGVYRVTLTVEDDSGSACATATDTVEVAIEPPPAADAGPDQEVWIGGANDALLLDGSGSRHPAGGTLDYTWTLSNGDVLKGQKVKHALAQAGELDVTLRVDDLFSRACSTATDTLRVVARARGEATEAP